MTHASFRNFGVIIDADESPAPGDFLVAQFPGILNCPSLVTSLLRVSLVGLEDGAGTAQPKGTIMKERLIRQPGLSRGITLVF
jgi:hypothetical protein